MGFYYYYYYFRVPRRRLIDSVHQKRKRKNGDRAREKKKNETKNVVRARPAAVDRSHIFIFTLKTKRFAGAAGSPRARAGGKVRAVIYGRSEINKTGGKKKKPVNTAQK